MKKVLSLVLSLAVMVSITGCGSGDKSVSGENVDSKYKAVTIENYNLSTEYTEKPDSVICLTLNSAEMLAALGEADSIIGVAQNFNSVEDVLPAHQDALANISYPEELNNGVPTLENVIALNPDLMATNSYYFNVPTFGKAEDYKTNGINLYVTEGTYETEISMQNTYNDIINLGKIFGKEEDAIILTDKMKDLVTKTNKKVADSEPVRVMSLDSKVKELYAVAAGDGLVEDMITLAGGKNVISDVKGQFSQIALEEIITRDPEVIIIHEYSTIENDAQNKIDLLKNTPELAEVSAIKNNNFLVVSLFSINPSIQNANVVEEMAKKFHPEAFK